jgi:glutamate-1-semialdehyde aminotransferase
LDGAGEPLGEGGGVTTIRALGFGIDRMPRIVRGQGSYLFDEHGRRYLDGSGELRELVEKFTLAVEGALG